MTALPSTSSKLSPIPSEADTTTKTSTYSTAKDYNEGTPLAEFNQVMDARLDQADLHDTTNLPYSIVDACRPFQPKESSNSIIPKVSFLDLMYMAFASATSPQDSANRKHFLHHIQQSGGGYCLVEFQDDVERDILDGLWDCMQDLYSMADETNNDTSTLLRHQTLTRQDNPTDHKNTGYQFLQVNSYQGTDILQERLGPKAVDQINHVYQLMSQIGQAFTSVLYTAAMDDDVTTTTPQEASTLVSSLLHENQHMTGTFQRLSRYVKDQDKNQREALRSHMDWTLATPIPVSSVDGLQIFDSRTQQWIRPELIARHNAQVEGRHYWNSKYVVVMTGKWLEILTNGTVQSTIHRVMSNPNSNQRMSAPFFMRPKDSVFQQIHLTFDNPSVHPTQTMTDFLRSQK